MPQPSRSPAIGIPFTELQSVDSTNNYALARIHAGLAQHGEAFFAHEQVAGKGQMGKKWTSGKSENILLSIVLNPRPLELTASFQLSAAIAVGVHDLFSRYAGDDSKIKWPNDLYWQDRKAGGILIETIVGSAPGSWKWAVAGIGININQAAFPADLPNPVSLKQITGRSFDTVGLAKELCEAISSRYLQLMEDGFEAIYRDYLSVLYRLNEPVRLKKGNRIFEATIKGVSPTGMLVVQHAMEEEFRVGEIEWIR